MMAISVDDDKGKERLHGNQQEGMPWVEKYRPTDLDGVVSQPDIIATSTVSFVP